MKVVWEELDSMSELPEIAHVTPETLAFLTALNKQKEEERVFQFLNGLDDLYNSQLLVTTPLPSVEVACSVLQQEESQWDVLNSVSIMYSAALYSQKTSSDKDKCSLCGYKWHPPEKCWKKVGYPSWHYKSRQVGKSKGVKNFKTVKVKSSTTSGNFGLDVKRTVNNVNGGNVVFTKEQFDQLMKCFPHTPRQNEAGHATDDELDHDYLADSR